MPVADPSLPLEGNGSALQPAPHSARASLPNSTDATQSSSTSPSSTSMPTKRQILKQVALSPLSLLSLLPIPSPQRLLLHTLSLGPVPRHIAFVMDGNRRWARTSHHTIQQGHLTGFATLKSVLEVCLNLDGLDTVTVYAFAIDNFRRSESEVSALMEIAKTRLIELAGHGELIARYSVRVRIAGRKELLPPDVREAVERVENMTKDNTKATLNICMPYASRDEMTGAARTCLDRKLRDVERAAVAAKAQQIASDKRDADSQQQQQQHPSSLSSSSPPPLENVLDNIDFSITPQDLSQNMQLSHSPPLDILVRTSGVSRLSDFMLWQCTESTHMHFVDKFWPQFGLLDMVPIILDWQRHQWSLALRKSCGWE
ncbi:hypothetical protein PHSY_004438 [Pseudozyma hubeiensis SY62]|uniref:Alkyl transferase n=1 Tax=Pseudozyma hubeiensis (strain SY62) TaxID=1305764 RepID=R9P6B0_PSEHS|nr:hypothetical protein PHSY_004438 [Pseudozyma hubeiensis SY62]GAC96854.1 hypothetical protein PHSY_004438 [Pseudozyma hubeiensis SY62]